MTQALIDSGSNRNIVSPSVLDLWNIQKRQKQVEERVTMASGPTNTWITFEAEMSILVGEGFPLYTATFDVMDLEVAPVILGTPFFKHFNPILDFSEQRLLPAIVKDRQPIVATSTIEGLPKEYQDFASVFDEVEADAHLPPRRQFDHKIVLMENSRPPYGPLYRHSETENEAMDAYLEKMLRLGYIRESHSEAASPCLFVTKKDSTLRLCVDYRGLNKVTVKSRYPLPLIDDLLGRLSKGKYFTTLDLRNGYHLVRIAEGDEWKTAFRTRHGLSEYLVMPFGLTNAPATFQHFMNHTLRGLLDKNVECYLDDIVIYSETLEEHVQHVRAVLDRLKQQNLYAKISKCDFHKSSVHWLGYVVSHNGLAMDRKRRMLYATGRSLDNYETYAAS